MLLLVLSSKHAILRNNRSFPSPSPIISSFTNGYFSEIRSNTSIKPKTNPLCGNSNLVGEIILKYVSDLLIFLSSILIFS